MQYPEFSNIIRQALDKLQLYRSREKAARKLSSPIAMLKDLRRQRKRSKLFRPSVMSWQSRPMSPQPSLSTISLNKLWHALEESTTRATLQVLGASVRYASHGLLNRIRCAKQQRAIRCYYSGRVRSNQRNQLQRLLAMLSGRDHANVKTRAVTDTRWTQRKSR